MINIALRLIRLYHNLSQKELADKMDCCVYQLSNIERGFQNPSMRMLNKYAEAYGIEVSQIMMFSEVLKTDLTDRDKMKEYLKITEKK